MNDLFVLTILGLIIFAVFFWIGLMQAFDNALITKQEKSDWADEHHKSCGAFHVVTCSNCKKTICTSCGKVIKWR